MNLNSLVSGAINAINPLVTAVVQQSTGYTIGADGTQLPTYSSTTVQAQVQALTSGDLQKLDAMNVQKVVQKAYLYGDFESVFRILGKGGDLVTIGPYTYLVTAVLERWPGWVSVGLTMQVD
ncbi:MAG: hypothetical protein GJU77_05690 [Ferrovum sp.]|nr:hypothetical protein [Ferrovum sp.]